MTTPEKIPVITLKSVSAQKYSRSTWRGRLEKILYSKIEIHPPHFPDWFRKLVYFLAVVVMILTVLDWTFCPPCQVCIGTRIGQICIEKIPVEPLWYPLNLL